MKRDEEIRQEGVLIKILLARSDMTMKELGARIGKSEATVSDVISGKNRSRKTYHLIMNILRERCAESELAAYESLVSNVSDACYGK